MAVDLSSPASLWGGSRDGVCVTGVRCCCVKLIPASLSILMSPTSSFIRLTSLVLVITERGPPRSLTTSAAERHD